MKKALNKTDFSRILVFDPHKRFISVYHSLTAAAKSYKTTSSSIYQACVGQSVSSCGHYFRFLQDDIEVDFLTDLGTLRLEEYDDLCGVKRAYYPGADMTRKGMKLKYNKQKIKQQ